MSVQSFSAGFFSASPVRSEFENTTKHASETIENKQSEFVKRDDFYWLRRTCRQVTKSLTRLREGNYASKLESRVLDTMTNGQIQEDETGLKEFSRILNKVEWRLQKLQHDGASQTEVRTSVAKCFLNARTDPMVRLGLQLVDDIDIETLQLDLTDVATRDDIPAGIRTEAQHMLNGLAYDRHGPHLPHPQP